ncbi:MAG: hypothetical protein ACXWV0_05060, partial [Flavisolibacter sp.]
TTVNGDHQEQDDSVVELHLMQLSNSLFIFQIVFLGFFNEGCMKTVNTFEPVIPHMNCLEACDPIEPVIQTKEQSVNIQPH